MKAIFSFLFVIGCISSGAQVITTIAGNHIPGYGGDNGPARVALLFGSYGIATDRTGNIYFTDGINYRVRKINTSGIITTIAGTGVDGHAGNNGPATAAQIGYAGGLAIDKNGNIFFTDGDFNSVRKVDTNGTITTIAGTGNIVGGYSGNGRPATVAELSDPIGLAFDKNNNLYIVDLGNYVIRKIDTSGIISTIAGNHYDSSSGDGGAATNADLERPMCVFVDSNNNIYIGTFLYIRKVDNTGIISTFAGNGSVGLGSDGVPATDAALELPSGLAVDNYGNILITDAANSRIRSVSTSGIIKTIAGTGTEGYYGDGGTPLSAQLNEPSAICVVGDSLYFVDMVNYVIRKISGLSDLSIATTNDLIPKIYPNPNNGSFRIELPGNALPARYQVVDMLGNEIKSGLLNQNTTTIDISNLEATNYLLQILASNKIYTEKITLIK